MNRKSTLLACLLACLILPELLPQDAAAIPAFARRYKMSCTTCHAPFPRLKAYGDEFAGNGFIITEEEKERDYVTGGDELLWLNRRFPIAARFDAYGVYEDKNDVESDLQTPWGLKLLSGGTLSHNIGYYFYFYMSEHGEVAGIEDAYIHFNDVGGVPFDIMVGQFQTSDPLMKRELRLTYEDYEIYKLRVGYSATNLAYDRGIMLVYGVERTGTDLVGFVVNGNGKGEAGENKKFDQDRFKNVGFRLNQGLGDVGSIGAFVYYGKERAVRTEPPEGRADNEVIYWGPDLTLSYGILDLSAQYLLRTDSNPGFVVSGGETKTRETQGMIAELVISPQGDLGRHFFTLLYNWIDSDLDTHDYETLSAAATYLVARNLRLTAEYTRNIEKESNRALIGIVSGF